MALRTLRKMSTNGDDTVAEWDPQTVSKERIDEIEVEFYKLVREGYLAADVTEKRDVLVQKFDPDADLLMIPRVMGG